MKDDRWAKEGGKVNEATMEKLKEILERFGDFMDGNVMYDVKEVLDIDEALAEIDKGFKVEIKEAE